MEKRKRKGDEAGMGLGEEKGESREGKGGGKIEGGWREEEAKGR